MPPPAEGQVVASLPLAPPVASLPLVPAPRPSAVDLGIAIRGDRPYLPPNVSPVPEVPEPGLIHAARYAYYFARSRWQRRGAIRQLGLEIKQDTEALDVVLGSLGRAARAAKIEGRVFSAENAAIDAAEARIGQHGHDSSEIELRKADENSKYIEIERERTQKVTAADSALAEVQRELTALETSRRNLRDKRKELERRVKAHHKAAEDHERHMQTLPMGDQRQDMRRVADGHRQEAAAIEPERTDVDAQLAGLDRPIAEATTRLDAAKVEVDTAKRSLNDAREGHLHRVAELDAELKRTAREVALAEGEIARRMVTLGTLVNLNRGEDGRFAELFASIDRLRGAITARTTEIERLTAEREAYDRGALVRGVSTIGGALLLAIALVVILRAIL